LLPIDQDDISSALERISIGLEKKDAVMSEKKRRLVAYREAGHAVLGALMSDFDVRRRCRRRCRWCRRSSGSSSSSRGSRSA